ncbi:hypothetical protein KIMH_04080 [Bombiscardovia apis]|uniref:Fungal lipase-like domain-containing protein n=1 Tax=Bombiscardovia apis TaxID=2932182 RepID=A0ABM8BBN5_9BIFI|nr:hypothetical protein [Bombiscardovia apis]BDR54297.1 hypothetical protein KIMH_04080 [Bombiscardovia apis]
MARQHQLYPTVPLSTTRSGFSLQALNQLCQYSYGVGRGESMTLLGQHSFPNERLGSYWVLDSLYCTRTGLEGMIAAPALSSGQADYQHMAVVFAGTNLKDDARNDLRATPSTFILPWKNPFGQAEQAEILVDKARYLAQEKGLVDPHILLTGHSLGGGLALLLGIRQQLPAQVFCAVDPWRVLNTAERERAQQSDSQMYVDYRLKNDRFTGPLNWFLSGRANRSAKVVWCGDGEAPFAHWLDNFQFDSSGNILAA